MSPSVHPAAGATTRQPRRREFLIGAGSLIAAPWVMTAAGWGQSSPGDRLQLGAIGVGRMGRGNLGRFLALAEAANAWFIAVCDLDQRRLEEGRQLVESTYRKQGLVDDSFRCQTYGDYRELLARDDLDGVLICTPDHWHALPAVAAAEAGKDIYLEKPLTYSIAEGQRLVAAVRSHQCVLQVGSQQRSDARFRQACELVRNGRLGRLHTIHVSLPPDQGTGDLTPQQVPPGLNYDWWLGPTADAAYCEDRVHPQRGYSRPGWLQIEAYCRGMITGWGAHMNDTAQWGAGTELCGPVAIRATAEFPDRGLFDVHTTFEAEATYADGLRVLMKTSEPAGVRFEGDDGWVFVTRGQIQASTPQLLAEPEEAYAVRLYRSSDHHRNFLDCMRSRTDPVAPVEVGHRSNSLCVITHIAMKLGRKLQWDPDQERFTDEEANRWLDYPHRAPWVLS